MRKPARNKGDMRNIEVTPAPAYRPSSRSGFRMCGPRRTLYFMDWRKNILTSPKDVAALIRETKRIAVLGIKPESHSRQPAFYVPRYMADKGYEIVPVPVYYPEITEILGQAIYRKLSDVPGEIDMVNVFRRPNDIPPHVEDIILTRPKSVWFQLGIRNDEAAEQLAREGIKVVQDMCLMVEHRYI